MTLTMDFYGQILKKLYLRMGGPIDIAQRVAEGHSWPWPFGDQGQVYGSTR